MKTEGKSFEISFASPKTTKTVSCIKTTAPLEAIVAPHKKKDASGYTNPSGGRNTTKRNPNSIDESDETARHGKRMELGRDWRRFSVPKGKPRKR